MNRRILLSYTGAFATTLAFPALAGNDSFDTLLAAVEADSAAFPGASGRVEAKALEASTFAAAQPSVGKSSRKVSARALRMITAFEVSNKRNYEKKLRNPIWPEGQSGVTIGIGYDLGYVDTVAFESDWKDYLDVTSRKTLLAALGKKGPAAKNLLERFQSIDVPFDAAYRQFVEQNLPKYVGLTEYALANTAELSADCLGALVSLTYNRGASYLILEAEDRRGRYAEMREVGRLMDAKDFKGIPYQIRKMKRLWQGKPEVRGLLERRDMEAALFELGLNT